MNGLFSTGVVRSRSFHYYTEGAHAGEAQLHSDGGIWGVEIYPRYRLAGHGRELMLQLMAVARDLGHRYVWLYVHADNYAARRLYQGLGFTVAADTQRGLLLRREL